MERINLVIVDRDDDYLREITRFVTNKFPKQFRLSTFSRVSEMLSYSKSKCKKDWILLIEQALIDDDIAREDFGTIVTLSPEPPGLQGEGLEQIYKYQNAQTIFDDLIEIYSRRISKTSSLISSKKDTKIIAVFSAGGGVGKTTISIASSIMFANLGLKVLYLNFESLQSTGYYFKAGPSRSLSNLLYYLGETVKGDSYKSLSSKFEKLETIDVETKVRYFSAPESACEVDELTPENIRQLFIQIKSACIYDAVFIDTAGNFDKKSMTIMDKADFIYLIETNDKSSEYKSRLFQQQLEVNKNSFSGDVTENMLIVRNKIKNAANCGNSSPFMIPYSQIFEDHENGYVPGTDCRFDKSIAELNARFFKAVENDN